MQAYYAAPLASMEIEEIEVPGVFLRIPQNAEIQRVSESLILIWAASEPGECRNRITEIPF